VAALHIHKEITIMDANPKVTVTDVSQQNVKQLQSELDVIEKNEMNNQALSEDEVKFVGELGWLAAAAVLVTSIAAGL
jgi:hypothetical protein